MVLILKSFLKNIYAGLYKSMKRFPIAITLSTSCAIILIVHSESKSNLDTLPRIAAVLALGIPLSLCISLIHERKNTKNKIVYILSYVLGAISIVIYYFTLFKSFEMIPMTRYIAISIALYTGFIFIPYLMDRTNFELYVIKISSKFFVTIIYFGILYAGIAAILFTINKLLGVNIPGKYYYYTFLIIAGTFAPGFFLSEVPQKDASFEAKDFPNAFKVLLLYIVMPIAAIYLAILYIYFGKVLITRTWPVGLVSHLVLWYSVICVGIIFFTSPLESNKWVQRFKFWLTKLIIPILAMMFVSIGIRIKAYGVTENRYYVITLGIWVLGNIIYLNFAKAKRNIIIPISLSIIAILCVFGPLSSFSVSRCSQNKRLDNILLKYDMIKDNKVISSKASSAKIPETDKKEITQILMYFNNNHGLKYVKCVPPDFKLDHMEDVFGFSPEDYQSPGSSRTYFAYNMASLDAPMDIKNYDYLFDFRGPRNQPIESIGDSASLKADYNNETSEIKIYNNGKEILNTNIKEFVAKIIEKYPSEKANTINPTDMTFTINNDIADIKLIIYNIYGSLDKFTKEISLDEANFYLLIKTK
jgi:hypothetical protein